MADESKGITRREFLITGARIVTAVGVGSAIGLGVKQIIDKSSEDVIESKYDLESISKTDPSIIKYKEVKKISTGLKTPRAIAVNNDDQIYIALDKCFQIISKEGYILSEIKLNNTPSCLTISEDGDIYLGMQDHIEVYNSDGKLKFIWKPYEKNAVFTSVAVL